MECDRLDVGATYSHCHFSTEEEVRKMWADEEYQKTVGQIFEKQKADLMDVYLKMTENCILKMNELTSSEIFKEEYPTAEISEVTSELDAVQDIQSPLIVLSSYQLNKQAPIATE